VVTRRLSPVVLALSFLVTPLLSAQSPTPDRRIGLRAGWWDAAQAAWNLRLVSTTAPTKDFIPAEAGNFDYMNSDIAFRGSYVFQGNFHGYQVWDVADPAHPRLVHAELCPEQQNDVSVYRNLLFLSGESQNGRVDCGVQGINEPVSSQRFRGVRVVDISDITHPRILANVQTCRGSHTHTLLTDPKDTANVYIYVSGQAPVRPAEELAGCSSRLPHEDTASARFRIEIIRVPLAHPEQASIVSHPRIFQALADPASHGATPADMAEAEREAAAAQAAGAFVVKFQGLPVPLPAAFTAPMLDSIMRSHGGSGVPTAADTAALRGAVQGIIDNEFLPPMGPGGVRYGPDQCHDITVYPAVGLAGGACAGYGFLLDIRDPVHPVRIAAVADSNFAYWHSATFNNDASKVLFTDEWGGGVAPRCRASDKPQWGADAIFTRSDATLTFQGYYKLPAPQTAAENCVAHNGNLIPVPGRDLMVQGWYQGGISVMDWTDPAHPTEIAYFDRGPMDSTKMEMAGSWSAYWYNGYIYSTEISRGLDVLELQPSAMLTQNEIDAAKTVKLAALNVQDQQPITWAASFAVARAYVDQLERSHGLTAARVGSVRARLGNAERASDAARRSALNSLAGQLGRDAATSADAPRVKALQAVVTALAR
jgi:hypothetical protein